LRGADRVTLQSGSLPVSLVMLQLSHRSLQALDHVHQHGELRLLRQLRSSCRHLQCREWGGLFFGHLVGGEVWPMGPINLIIGLAHLLNGTYLCRHLLTL